LKTKHYTLDKGLESKVDAAIKNVNESINKLENELK